MVHRKRPRDAEDEPQAHFPAPAKPFAQRIEEANEAHRSDSYALLSSNAPIKPMQLPIKPMQLKAMIDDAVHVQMLKYRAEIQPLLKKTDKRFDDQQTRFNDQEGRFDDHEGRLEDLEALEARIEDLETCIEEQKEQLEEQGDRLEKQDEKIQELESEAIMRDLRLDSAVELQQYCDDIQDERMGEIESDVVKLETYVDRVSPWYNRTG